MSGDRDLDTLFATPLARFVAVRKELVDAARKGGRGDLAIRIGAMKRPSPVVWLANALAREHPDEVEAVLSAGDAVRKAYESGDVGDVREATQRRQQAVSAALRRARALSDEAGLGDTAERKLARTLLGASMDAPQGKLLARGRLEHEVEPPALEGLLGTAPKLSPKPKAAAKRDPAPDHPAEAKARAKAVREQERAVERAEAAAKRAEERADETAAEVAAAEKAAATAAAAAKEARRSADAERRKLEALKAR